MAEATRRYGRWYTLWAGICKPGETCADIERNRVMREQLRQQQKQQERQEKKEDN